MSQENVAVVREMNLAFNAEDDAWVDFYDADVEFVMPPEWPEDRVYRGRDAVKGLSAALREVFGGQEWRIERLIDAGGDCVVALAHAHASLEGGALEQRIAAVHYVAGGKILRQLAFFSWEEALSAAGVEDAGR